MQTPMIECPHISVLLTDEDSDECVMIRYRDTVIRLHTTEAVDLIHKLSASVCKWIADQNLALLVNEGVFTPCRCGTLRCGDLSGPCPSCGSYL